MKVSSLIRTLLIAVSMTYVFGACANRNQAEEALDEDISMLSQELQNNLREEKIRLATAAEQVVSEYNSKAEDIKFDAIKNNRNLSSDVKDRLIDMEHMIEQLENKISNIEYQTRDSWMKFKEDVTRDISNIKAGIRTISSGNKS